MNMRGVRKAGMTILILPVLWSCNEREDVTTTNTEPSKEHDAGMPEPVTEQMGMRPRMVKGHLEALPVPGRKGFVFNPYTEQIVDVTGVPSGTLVVDPNDSDGMRKFRVP